MVMKKVRNKNLPGFYYVGAQIVIHKDRKEPHNVVAKFLVKFGPKLEKSEKWLKSFPPINLPNGDESIRMVLRLPIGYRERRDVIHQYKQLGVNHVNARFRMLSDHAGPENKFVYIRPTEPTEDDKGGGHNHQQDVERSEHV